MVLLVSGNSTLTRLNEYNNFNYMSIPETSEIVCCNCGEKNLSASWFSMNSSGSSDLDSRPPEDYRSAINYVFVMRCKSCGYCNSNIETNFDNLNSIISSRTYQDQLNNKQFPKKANEFLCKALILESYQEIENAAWAYIHAAWNCDDHEKYVQGKFCRHKAFELFTLANMTSLLNFENDGDFPLLMIDICRRIENFEKANKICDIRLKIENDVLHRKILFFQKSLIELQDIKVYKIEDAVKYCHDNINASVNEEDCDECESIYYEPDRFQENDYDRDNFDAMTDGQLGDYDDFNGNIDDIETWARG